MSLNINKEKLTTMISDVLKKQKANLYELNFNYEFENDVIQVLVEMEDNSIVTFEVLSKINDELSVLLDYFSELDGKYILEVSSAGIEKQIKNIEALKKAVPSHVYVQYKNEKKSGEFTGKLLSEENNEFKFSFFDKGQPKKLSLKWEEITFIRYAVDFKN